MVKPMLATLVDEQFDRAGWLFEMKWDGYRAIAETGKRVLLYSRNQLDFSKHYEPIVKALKKIRHRAIFDGEIVVLDAQGRTSFGSLQMYDHVQGGQLAYEIFDLLSLDGKDLRKKPLAERKRLLKSIVPKSDVLRYSDHIEDKGKALFALAEKKGLEGIMAKDGQSPYREGVRGREWVKIKTHARQEVVVAGFTEPQRQRKHFGALVAGVYEGGKLTYVGHVGGGFNQKTLAEAYRKLKPLVIKTSPFEEKIKTNTPVRWVKPVLIGEVKFAEWTGEGHMRQPIFVGWRVDKKARDVRREVLKTRQPKLKKPEEPKPFELTHLDKPYWPKEGWTKGDVFDYYRAVSDVILPYLKDRPMSLNRHPHGIVGESFFQKDVSMLHLPPWLKTVEIHSESAGEILAPLCQNEKSLLFMANLGAIEMNPWNSRTKHLDKPDYLVVDLDPEGVPFRKVIDVALAVHAFFEGLGFPNICKTSGGRGLHVYVPLGAKYTHEEVREFATLIATILGEKKFPNLISLERSPKKRQARVYFDILQNKMGATNAAAYSLRPRPGAPVSTPLKWSEVKSGLDPLAFNIETVPKRVDKLGDLFAPILGKGIDMEAALKALEKRGNMKA